MEIKIDFKADWKEYMLKQILAGGYKIEESEDYKSISYKFFNLHRRSIHQHPRKVLESKGVLYGIWYGIWGHTLISDYLFDSIL
ncbi:MAG: hypothetical protein E3K37_02300 [Candidatus Kuenenia sp.]|nr:hypothetical protein [Candidatus Kuenenia hertensis]